MNAPNQSTDILIASHQGDLKGGAGKSLLELIKYLHDLKFSIHVILPSEDEFSEALDDLRIKYTILRLEWWLEPGYKASRIHNARCIDACISLIKELNPALCVTNTVVIPSLAIAAKLTNTRHVWILREFGDKDHGLKFRVSQDNIKYLVDELSDKVFCNSAAVADYYKNGFSHNTSVGIVYPHVSVSEKTKKVPVFSKRANSINLCLVSQIQEGKGQLEAVQAVKTLVDEGYDVELALVGDIISKPYMNKINSFIKKVSLESKIHVLGFKHNPSAYVKSADIALVCSKNEAFGRVTVEAMLLGTPVVAPHSGGTLEIIKDNETGLLYKPGDSADLAKKIVKMKDKAFAAQISINAKKAAVQKFSKEGNNKELLEYLRSVINKKLQPSRQTWSPIYDIYELLQDERTWHKKEIKGYHEEAARHYKKAQEFKSENLKLKAELSHISNSLILRGLLSAKKQKARVIRKIRQKNS